MNYYHIAPYACSGEYFISTPEDESETIPGSLVLNFNTTHIQSPFFEMGGGGFFVFTSLKDVFDKSDFTELSFQKVDKIILPDGYDESYSILNGNEIWKVNIPSQGELKDFYLWKGVLVVVSQKALDFLVTHNGFKDLIGGIMLGKEYEYLSNRFYIEDGDMKKYFTTKYRQDLRFVENKSNLAMDEYRRRNGLPPLKRKEI